MDIELCIDSQDSCLAARKFGIKRVELCSALEVGGLTPSYGLIQRCSSIKEVEIHCMIRPRPGDFVYTVAEKQLMLMDIMAAGSAGAKGVVFGLLTHQNEVDVPAMQEMCDFARQMNLEVTYHRAFDLIPNKEKALNDLINIGCTRILTSGGERKAIDGLNTIKQMVNQAAGRIQIMAGSGVSSSNVSTLYQSGIDAIHFTARKAELVQDNLGFGTKYIVDEQKIMGILSVPTK
ncbi:MAG: copper homeostasis protein CutC [Flavobacteriales bacterium]|jgi:copper homeostasis protein|nr:copper homeostasis protein CutC [Flavobacteriales bacterium]